MSLPPFAPALDGRAASCTARARTSVGRRLRVLALACVAALVPACDGCATSRSKDARKVAVDAGRVLRGRPKTQRELPTTSAEIYLGNLDGQIAELARLTSEQPNILANRQRLSAALHLRGRVRGDLDEIQRGIDEASACARADPSDATCRLMRAEQEQSLHRFKESRADLALARTLGAAPARVADLEAELDWNDGLYDKAIAAIRKARRERPSTATWMREAQLDHDLGLDDASEAAFESAEDLITDTGPLAVAHLDVQRGIQRSERGLREDACLFFREAAERMPPYVAANEHLAEALHALGKDDEAIAIYEKVVQLSTDPEFVHALAQLRAAKGRRDEARALEAKARARYEELLQKYPEAMYWHASEFFLATGEAQRALDLLRKNLELRPNSASHVALARAELANGHTNEAKRAIDTALAMPVRSAALFWTASRVYDKAGDAAAAAAFRARAKRANPRIEDDER